MNTLVRPTTIQPLLNRRSSVSSAPETGLACMRGIQPRPSLQVFPLPASFPTRIARDLQVRLRTVLPAPHMKQPQRVAPVSNIYMQYSRH
jgi:hypothetical protein